MNLNPRRLALGGIGVAVLLCALAAWVSLREGDPTPSSAPTLLTPQVARAAPPAPPREPPTPPGGGLHIQGFVRDASGPVAGVRVSASRPVPGETISELWCPKERARDAPSRPVVARLPECMAEVGPLVQELVSARHGEALVHAETTTAVDGSFSLEGLPEGSFALWALGEHGAKLRAGVTAGSEGVELRLTDGVTVEFRVVDASDTPVPDAAVTVLHARHTRFFDARTGTQGHFGVGPLPRAEYALVVSKEGWLPAYVPHVSLRERGDEVRLLRPRRLTGHVLFQGTPAPGAEVWIKPPEGPERLALTDAEGRFAFEVLSAGTHEFVASREGRYGLRRIDPSRLKPPAEVELLLGSAFHIEGTVRDDAGRPVAEARITVEPPPGWYKPWSTITDEQGRYRIGPLEEDSYAFVLSSVGHSDVTNVLRALWPDMGPVDFTLSRVPSIEGQVVDEAGQPLPDIALSLEHPTRPKPWVSAHRRPVEGVRLHERATTDAQGRFQVDVLTPEVWFLVVQEEDFLPERLSVQAPAQGVRIVLRPGGTVLGAVTDERGEPVGRAEVRAWVADLDEEPQRTTETTEEGRFSLRGLKPERYLVEATLDEDGVVRFGARRIELRGTEQVEVALRFQAGRTLSGIAVDSQGRPLSDVLVNSSLSWEDTSPSLDDQGSFKFAASAVETGAEGRFTLRHLPEGPFVLSAYKYQYTLLPSESVGGRPTKEGDLRVPEGVTEVRLVLERHTRVEGRVVGPDGAPLRSFSLNGQAWTGARGRFHRVFEHPGPQRLEFSAPGMAPLVRTVEVRLGPDMDLGDVRMAQAPAP